MEQSLRSLELVQFGLTSFSLPSKEGNNNCKGAVTHLVTFWDLYFPRLRSQTLELQCRHPPEAGELATGKSAQNLLDSLLLFH